MRLELNLDFEERFAPERFFFGVAYAPYCEGGGLNAPDGPKNTDWTKRGHREAGGYDEGIGFWDHHAEHIGLAASLGLNAFRFGIEWARCQPSPSADPVEAPPWDASALDRYADMVGLVFDHGMQPIVTLHHFTHPLWLGVDIWLDDRGPDLLVEAQLRIVDEINARLMAGGGTVMSHFLVYNEPNLVPLFFNSLDWYPGDRKGPEYMLPAFDTMLSHYVKAYDGLHDLFEARGWGSPHVGYTIASMCSYEYDKQLDDLMRLRTRGVARADVAAEIARHRKAWRARIDDLAASQHHHSLEESRRDGHVVSHRDDRPARRVQPRDDGADARGRGRIEPARRLVEDHEGRVGGEDRGQGHEPLLAGRQVVRVGARARRQPDRIERGIDET